MNEMKVRLRRKYVGGLLVSEACFWYCRLRLNRFCSCSTTFDEERCANIRFSQDRGGLLEVNWWRSRFHDSNLPNVLKRKGLPKETAVQYLGRGHRRTADAVFLS